MTWVMGCCNERGVLRPLLSATSRNNSHNRAENGNGNNAAGNNNNNSLFGRFTKFIRGSNKTKKDISHRLKNRRVLNNGGSVYNDEGDYEEFTDDEDVILGYSRSKSGRRCQHFLAMLRKVGLLVWKNLLLRRRHYIVTAFEIILPTFFAIILTAAKTQVPESPEFSTGNTTITFPATSEAVLKSQWHDKMFCDGCFIAYTPETDQTRQVISELQTRTGDVRLGYKGFQNEEEIEKLLASMDLNNTDRRELRGAIVFENGNIASYKIRLVDDLAKTELLFPYFQLPGPGDLRDWTHYASSGFIGLQILLDQIITKILTKRDVSHDISLQAFPYPPYKMTVDFRLIYFILLPQIFVIGFIFMVPSIIRGVVSEKETGIKELLKLNGVPGWMQWLGWMLNSIIIISVSISIVIFLFFWTFNMEAGAVLVYSDPSVWFVVLLFYAISSTAFCFFISSFFRKPTLATTVGIILWLGSYYFLFLRIEKSYQTSSFTEKMAVSLIPNMALHLAIKVMSAFEGKAVGAHWYNIAEPISSVDELSLGLVLLMFLINTCLYMFLTVYVENIFPSEYGVRKPWYYLFQKNTWWKNSQRIKSRTMGEDSNHNDNADTPGFEAQPSDMIAGVDIRNLQKKFGRNKVAVSGVSAKMYDGEIFALLGHNGAGKTTTISMLTGLFAPSGGTATVNGYDITTDLDQVRENLGLCPQHNMLFDKLTVLEHLLFFGQLKGMTKPAALKEAHQLLQKLQLAEKSSALSMALSGGQKRKLSLGIALIGGTKVVMLDEPTSGMDPEARRAIWDLLLELRGHRTILLTTHFMEEADVLGDRIGIMANGKLQCCGTPIFLKKFYGTGYTLKLSISEAAKPNDILTFIQNHISNASIKATLATNASELLITLPTETSTTGALSEMFPSLNTNKERLGIRSVGLSLTTMDEVFVRVGQLADEHASFETRESSVEGTPNASRKTADERLTLKSDVDRTKGLKLAAEQFMALLSKKYTYSIRKRKLMISQLIIPIVILIMAIRVSNTTFEPPSQPPPLRITLDGYKSPITLYSANQEQMKQLLASVIGPSGRSIPGDMTLLDSLTSLGISDLAVYRERHIAAVDVNSTNMNAMFSTIPYHSAPLAINIAMNTILKSLQPPNNNNRIEVTNHPLRSQVHELLDAAKSNPVFSSTVPILFAIFMPIGLALLAASFIILPIEEKLCKAKQLQLMTGVSPFIYWSSAFVWDFVAAFVVICAMITCFPIFQTFEVFTAYGGAGVAFLILLVYSYAAISFSYLVSLFASTIPGGFSFVTIIHIVSGIILCITVHLMEMIGSDVESLADKFRWTGRLFPTFGAAISTMRYTEIATKNARCNILSTTAKKLLCDPNIAVSNQYSKECCDNCKEIGKSCFTPTPFLQWTYKKESDSEFGFGNAIEVPGIWQELFYVMVMAVVYQIILMLLEYGVIQKCISKLLQVDESVFHENINDEDVLKESQRVRNLVANGMDDALVVNNLSKSYGELAAVSKLSFGVHHGECFGLLGVNGAGKTTTFRMLTGDEFRSSGNAYAFMNSLDKHQRAFFSNIGYCPQFDGIIGVLNGREMLQLFCRLRGIPGSHGRKEAEKWLHNFGLSESGDVQCQKYSGGMKRRLSVAMAMIGDPPLLLLDEPTSGVDPVSRRQFWKVLESVKNSGQSIILTSHSMEECEALCSRLGIMVNGQLQCFGGVQHLKAKFAQGFSLTVKLKSMVPVDSSEMNSLTSSICGKFEPCSLKDKHQSILQFQVKNPSIPWDVLFKTMEDLKQQFSDVIEDYSVNETTLEEVFLSFARMQYGDRKANVSILRRLLTCQC